MTSCCDHNAPPGGCNQGRKCPLRVVSPPPDDAQIEDALAFGSVVALVTLISLVAVCGASGWAWGRYGDLIQRLFWTAATLYF